MCYALYWRCLLKPDFTGKSIFITGASSGIGEQLAKRFVEANAKKVFILARRIPELERVKKECEEIRRDCEVECIQIDLAEPEKCLEFAKTFGQRVDILVNNGGISQRDEFINCDFSIAEKLMNVNCLSPIALIKGFLPRFVK